LFRVSLSRGRRRRPVEHRPMASAPVSNGSCLDVIGVFSTPPRRPGAHTGARSSARK
jgi:hypothetical protein